MGKSTLTPEALTFIETSSQTLGLAVAELERISAQEKEAAAVMDETVQMLLDNQLIANDERGSAKQMLSKHATTIQLLANTIDFMAARHRNELAELRAKSAAMNQGSPAADYQPRDLTNDPDAALIAASPGLRHKLHS